jgi:diaminohydroxyphosphoribosylaminopyrimidine deaminase/5-amino-6-(5-phosphoribosylamino)uracil reductase
VTLGSVERIMWHRTGAAPERARRRDWGIDQAWNVVLAAAAAAEDCTAADQCAAFAIGDEGDIRRVASTDPEAGLIWSPRTGWELKLSEFDPQHVLIDLYLPVCSATAARPITVGHLGQSLDGFIATHAGESQFVTGQENLRHMHRMRALCDAIVVGAGTVAADDPQLTTRHVPGPSPLRVIYDPTRRLGDHYKVFSDDAADTIYVCARSFSRPGESHFGQAAIVPVDDDEGAVDAVGLLALLHARGCSRVFVEGGGVTVSMFLEAHLLDRLQMAIAPLIIGDGRPAIRLQPPVNLSDCHRPSYRVFRMGGDVLFDCDLRTTHAERDLNPSDQPPLSRII